MSYLFLVELFFVSILIFSLGISSSVEVLKTRISILLNCYLIIEILIAQMGKRTEKRLM